MRILSYRTDSAWWPVEEQLPDGEGIKNGPGTDEIERAFSDCFRCNNLVILTGLGTSMAVNLDKTRLATDGRVPLADKKIAPSMRDLWDATRNTNTNEFDEVLRLVRFPDGEAGNIEGLLSHCRVAEGFITQAEGRDRIKAFVDNAETMVRDMVSFLTPDDDLSMHANFLRRLIRRSSRKPRPKLFTTNYDLCFENAARQGRYVILDGFSHTSPQVFDSQYFSHDIVVRNAETDTFDFVPNVFHFYKLHGSLDWTRNDNTGEIEKAPGTKRPLLVYPRNTKYELAFSQPYLEMMSALQAALRQKDTGLLILGFGFKDAHIAEPVLAAIRSNLSLQVVICDPALGPREDASDGAEGNNAHLRAVAHLISQGDARLALVSATFEQVVPRLPDIAAQTELEQHIERVRGLRKKDHDPQRA